MAYFNHLCLCCERRPWKVDWPVPRAYKACTKARKEGTPLLIDCAIIIARVALRKQSTEVTLMQRNILPMTVGMSSDMLSYIEVGNKPAFPRTESWRKRVCTPPIAVNKGEESEVSLVETPLVSIKKMQELALSFSLPLVDEGTELDWWTLGALIR